MKESEKIFPVLCDDKSCTGCLACVNACFHEALSITTNQEGFYRPHIETDKCVGCGLCEKCCPIITPSSNTDKTFQKNERSIKVYAAWNKDEKVRGDSSSGGAFSALAEKILDDSGVIVGAAYDEHLKVCHQIITCREHLSKLRKSKYVQSYIGDTMRQVKGFLIKGIPVMFVGTPCQCAALNSFLRKSYDNLLLVDFICHGVPSPLFFERYKQWLEETFHEEIINFNFRAKPKGWYDALRMIETVTGKTLCLKGKKDCYWVGFNNNNNLQESCYNCHFLGFPHVSDITIADFWGIGKRTPFEAKNQIEKGVSMMVANSSRGGKAIEENPYLELYERTMAEAISRNQAAVKSSERPPSRDYIYTDLQRMPFKDFANVYLKPSRKTVLVKIWREYFPAFLVSGIRKALQ